MFYQVQIVVQQDGGSAAAVLFCLMPAAQKAYRKAVKSFWQSSKPRLWNRSKTNPCDVTWSPHYPLQGHFICIVAVVLRMLIGSLFQLPQKVRPVQAGEATRVLYSDELHAIPSVVRLLMLRTLCSVCDLQTSKIIPFILSKLSLRFSLHRCLVVWSLLNIDISFSWMSSSHLTATREKADI